MVTIQVTNLSSRILGFLDYKISRMIDKQLSYQVEGVEFIPAVMEGRWDGITHLFSTRTNSFSTGLLDRVCSILDQNNIQYQIQDLRIKPQAQQPIPTNTTLRQDQEDVVNTCINKVRGICMLPTGYGKSFSQVDLICRLNLPTIIITHKLDIAEQFKTWFKERANIGIGYIGNGIINPKHITVCMIQTLVNAFKIKSKEIKSENINMSDYQKIYNVCTNTQVVVTDEMHAMLTGDVWSKIFIRFTNAYFRLGFSATPYKCFPEQLAAEAIYGPVIAEESYTNCIKKGYIVKPEVIVYNYKQQGLPYGMRFQAAYKERIVENEDRNFLICQIALKYFQSNKKVFIPVTHLNHGRLLKQMLETVVGKGNVIFLEGCKTVEERQKGMKDFENGGKILLGTQILNEGVNIKSMDVLINARCSLSKSVFLQTIGRCLRLYPGKTKATIIDIQDKNIKYFSYHGRERYQILQDCEFDIKEVNNIEDINI